MIIDHYDIDYHCDHHYHYFDYHETMTTLDHVHVDIKNKVILIVILLLSLIQ